MSTLINSNDNKYIHCNFSTINNMLKENKCFLCQQIFPRGKQKRVFQILQLLQFFEIYETNYNISILLYGENLINCYQEYQYYGGIQNIDTISEQLRKHDIDFWMSGLVCSQNADCVKQIDAILNLNLNQDNRNTTNTSSTSMGMGNDKLSKIVKQAREDCPPGCGCDNPWSFLS